MNIKYIVSYLGLLPFIFLIIDGYYLGMLDITFILNLSIMMSCIIFTFIGAYNWDFHKDNTILEIYGFIPSLLSMIVLLLNLFEFDNVILIYILIVCLLVQLTLDLYRTLKFTFPIQYFLKLRLPVTSTLCMSLWVISNL